MKKFFTLLVAFLTALTCSTVLANEKLIEASGEYVMDSRLDETPSSATNRAREEAKRSAVDKAGVYLQSYSKRVGLVLAEDEIRTVSARLIKIQDESNNVEVIGNNLLKFTVDIKVLVEELDENALKSIINDRSTLEELTRKNKELQEKYDALNRQMNEYRSAYDSASESEREEIKQNVTRNAEKFSAVNEFSKANDFSGRKNYSQALAAYDTALRLDPQFAEAYNNRGIIKYDLGQFSAAIEDYSAAIRLKPNYANALNNRGNAYAALKQFQNAAKDLQAALKLDGKYATAHNNLGNVYLSQKNFDAAVDEYSRAIKLSPNFTEAYYNRAVAYYNQENYSKALTDAQKVLQLNPNDALAKALCERIRRKS